MGLVKGPLLSIDARGKIANTLVFSGWKGLKTVRAYVVPANPNSGAQQAQRGLLTAAVAWWHDVGYTVLDLAAWAFRASLAKSPRSGFNEFTSDHIAKALTSEDYGVLKDVTTGTVTTSGFHVLADGVGTNDYIVSVGTNPRALLTEFTAPAIAGAIDITVTGLTADTKYYFKVRCNEAADKAETGVYTQATAAA